MKAVFGLGNPGPGYALTRHNVGFQVIDLYRKAYRVRKKARITGFSLVYRLEDLLLVKPMTFMNESGRAVKAIIDNWQIPLVNALIVYDDLDLPFGALRILPGGGSGAHKGMISILSALGDESIPRMRIGIGIKPRPSDTVEHVLTRFTPEEWQRLVPTLRRASQAIELFRTADTNSVMNCFNPLRKPVAEEGTTGIL